MLKSGRKQRNVITEPGWLAHVSRELSVPCAWLGQPMGALGSGGTECGCGTLHTAPAGCALVSHGVHGDFQGACSAWAQCCPF